jgi:hypothetical protein
MKRAASDVVYSAFFQSDEIAYNVNNIYRSKYFIFYGRINHSRKDNEIPKDKK